MIYANITLPSKISVQHDRVEGQCGAMLIFHTNFHDRVTVTLSEAQISELKNQLQEIIDSI